VCTCTCDIILGNAVLMQEPMHMQNHGNCVSWGVFQMQHLSNGVPAGQLPPVTWHKSRRSNPHGNCVEVAALPGGGFAVRNSRDPEGPALIYTADELTAFIQGARDGDFDHLVS
jgi:hypothetical protein